MFLEERRMERQKTGPEEIRDWQQILSRKHVQEPEVSLFFFFYFMIYFLMVSPFCHIFFGGVSCLPTAAGEHEPRPGRGWTGTASSASMQELEREGGDEAGW